MYTNTEWMSMTLTFFLAGVWSYFGFKFTIELEFVIRKSNLQVSHPIKQMLGGRNRKKETHNNESLIFIQMTVLDIPWVLLGVDSFTAKIGCDSELYSLLVNWFYSPSCIYLKNGFRCDPDFLFYFSPYLFHGCFRLPVFGHPSGWEVNGGHWRDIYQTTRYCLIVVSITVSWSLCLLQEYSRAGARQIQQNKLCAQRRLRSAWAFAQSGQIGFPQALENMENGWKKFNAWKNHGIWKFMKKHGKIMEF